MKYIFAAITYFIVIGLETLCAQEQNNNITANTFTVNSAILNEERTGFINLPDSYNESSEVEKTYPIIILLDGYVHFKTAASIVHFMSSDRVGNNFMPESIIVAIENVDRERDFTHTKIKTKRKNTMGGGRNFLNFIEKELIPYVDSNYRTESDRTLIGHSLGGLLTLNAYRDENSLFDAYIAIDPSISWDDTLMKTKVDAISSKSFNKKLFIATANQEERRYEKNKKRHDQFYALLEQKSNKGMQVKIESYDDENHRSVPLKAIYDGLRYLNQ